METSANYIIKTPELCVGEVMAELNRHEATLLDNANNENELISFHALISSRNMEGFEAWLIEVTGGRCNHNYRLTSA